jgi:hypothetical protein
MPDQSGTMTRHDADRTHHEPHRTMNKPAPGPRSGTGTSGRFDALDGQRRLRPRQQRRVRRYFDTVVNEYLIAQGARHRATRSSVWSWPMRYFASITFLTSCMACGWQRQQQRAVRNRAVQERRIGGFGEKNCPCVRGPGVAQPRRCRPTCAPRWACLTADTPNSLQSAARREREAKERENKGAAHKS